MTMSTEIPDPDDVTEAQLADHFEGRPLSDPLRYHKNGICKRCEEKNTLRMKHAGTDAEELADETFNEGERIRFTASYEEFQNPDEQLWQIRGLFHDRHPHKPVEEMGAKGVAQVVGIGTAVPVTDAVITDAPSGYDLIDGDLVLADIAIEFYSPPSEGEDTTPTEQEGTIIATGIGDRPDWPEEENEWRRKLIQSAQTTED